MVGQQKQVLLHSSDFCRDSGKRKIHKCPPLSLLDDTGTNAEYGKRPYSRRCDFLVYIIEDNSFALYSIRHQEGPSYEIFTVLMGMRHRVRNIRYLMSLCDEMYEDGHLGERLTELDRMYKICSSEWSTITL